MVTSRSRHVRKGSITTSIRPVELVDGRVWSSIRSRCTRAKNAWCSLNRPVNASVSCGDLGAHSPLGQIGQHRGVALPGDQRFEHGPSRDPGDVGGHRGQLDPGVFEQLLQPLDLPGAFPGDRGAGAGQITELPDRLGWARTRPGPDRARPVGPAKPRRRRRSCGPGRFFTCRGIDQHHLEGPVLQAGSRTASSSRWWPPSPHSVTSLGDQMVTQRQDLAGHRAPGRHRRSRPCARPSTGDPDADLGVPLRYIQPGTAGMNHFHRPFTPFLTCTPALVPSRGGQGNAEV